MKQNAPSHDSYSQNNFAQTQYLYRKNKFLK